MIKLNGLEIKPTIFPDGTSQVWKLDLISSRKDNVIEWEYENNSELITVVQLGILLLTETSYKPILNIPFLPYSRQDKEVSNITTFGLKCFLKLLAGVEDIFSSIVTVDVHNPKSLVGSKIHNLIPQGQIREVIGTTKTDVICFPDKGASQRDYGIAAPFFSLDKKRNQSTGEIEGLFCPLPLDLTDNVVLIVDDICDGGSTFIEASKLLYKMGASEVHLYTSHGLYTKGIGVLKEAGIKRIFNHKGEVL
jgi:ribose-phosphate pyrophosphokinase